MTFKYYFSYIVCGTDACNGGVSLAATANTQSLTSVGFGKCILSGKNTADLLNVKGLVICFYLSWSGSILQLRQDIIKVGSKL